MASALSFAQLCWSKTSVNLSNWFSFILFQKSVLTEQLQLFPSDRGTDFSLIKSQQCQALNDREFLAWNEGSVASIEKGYRTLLTFSKFTQRCRRLLLSDADIALFS
ncbi:MAG: hypothetical protein F6J95_024765 [Leptolyngbya sp. SIO1E4]|nr:hypothetical protein [Leptolyngbya sp. SIO1E4]